VAWQVRGSTVLVTGATGGLGLEASVELARLGARVVMVGRDPSRTASARTTVAARSGSDDVATLLCDFESQVAVRALAADFRARHRRLDVLVNNVGGVNKARRVTADGIEATFAVNHLGPFLLTNLLLGLLVDSAPARIVTVASVGHRRGTLDFDDLGLERGYWIMKAYARSKLANVLFASELARRLAGAGVSSNSLHPGSVATNIWSGAPLWARPVVNLFYRPFFISVEQGASYVVQLAADPALEGVSGAYFEKGRRVPTSALAQDDGLARRLWDVSAAMVGLPTSTPPG